MGIRTQTAPSASRSPQRSQGSAEGKTARGRGSEHAELDREGRGPAGKQHRRRAKTDLEQQGKMCQATDDAAKVACLYVVVAREFVASTSSENAAP